MKNTVKMRLPEDLIFFEKIEEWLSEKAAEGLILEKITARKATFRKSEPTFILYKIAMFADEPTDEEYQEYKEMGWEVFAKKIGRLVADWDLYYVFASTSSDAKDLSSIQVIHENRKKEAKGITSKLFYPIIFGFGYSLAYLIIQLITGELFYKLVLQPFHMDMVLMLFSLYTFLLIPQTIVIIRSIRFNKLLKENTVIKYDKFFNATRNLRKHIFIVAILIYIGLITTSLYLTSSFFSVPSSSNFENIVRLVDIEDENFEIGTSEVDNLEYDLVSVSKTIRTWESGHTKDDGEESNAHLRTHYYEIKLPQLAEKAMEGLYNKNDFLYENDDRVDIESEVIDGFIVVVERSISVYYYKDNQVAYIYYVGDTSYEEVIDAIESKY